MARVLLPGKIEWVDGLTNFTRTATFLEKDLNRKQLSFIYTDSTKEKSH